MAILTREQAKKSFYPYQANNSSQGVGVSNGTGLGLLLSDYPSDPIIPARTGFVFVVDRILVYSMHPVDTDGLDDSVVTVRITDGTTPSYLYFKTLRQDAGGEYHMTLVDFKTNGKLVLKEGFALSAKISDASGTVATFDGPASIMVYGEWIQVEEARQRDILGDVYYGSAHDFSTNTTLVPKKDGKQFVIEGFYVIGLSNTSPAAIQNLTVRFSSADNGGGTNYIALKYSSRRGDQQFRINHGTSDCHLAGPASYGVTAIQTTAKKYSVIVIGRYVLNGNTFDPTGVHTTPNSIASKGDRFWVYKSITGSNTASLTPSTKPGSVIIEGFIFSGVRSSGGLPSTFSVGYTSGANSLPLTPTLYATQDWDAQYLLDGLGVPVLNSATIKGLVGALVAWDEANVTIWGRFVSDKTAKVTVV